MERRDSGYFCLGALMVYISVICYTLLIWHGGRNVSEILWIYLKYPSGKEPDGKYLERGDKT